MNVHKCYYCGKEISSEQRNLHVKVRKRIYPVCSDKCKDSAERFLSILLAD